MQQLEGKRRMQFDDILIVLRHRPYVLSRKGMDEPSMLRSGWSFCIRSDSSRWSFFWPTILPNISGCL